MAITGLQKFTNSLSEKLKEDIRTTLLDGEQIIDSQTCNRAISGIALGSSIGGTLFITNLRVIFETAKLQTKIKNITDIISLSDIIEVKKGDNVGIGNMIPIGGLNKDKAVIVQTSDTAYVFVPQDPDKCIESIVAVNSSITVGEKANSVESLKASSTGKSMEGNSLLDKAFKAANSVASASKDAISKGVDAVKAVKAESDAYKVPLEGAIVRYDVLYKGGHPKYPKERSDTIGLNVMQDRFAFTKGYVSKDWFEDFDISYNSISKFEIIKRQTSNMDMLLSDNAADAKALEVENTLAITYTDENGTELRLRLEMLTGMTIYTQAQKCQEMLDILRQHNILNKLNKTSVNSPAPSVPTASTAPVVDPIEQIKKYKELLDMGIISEDEFSVKKKELLGL